MDYGLTCQLIDAVMYQCRGGKLGIHQPRRNTTMHSPTNNAHPQQVVILIKEKEEKLLV